MTGPAVPAPPSLVSRDDGGFETLDGRCTIEPDGDGYAVWDRRPGRLLLVDGEQRPAVRVAWRRSVADAVAALATYCDALDGAAVQR